MLVNDYRIFEEEYIDVEQVSDLFSEIKRLHEFIMSLKDRICIEKNSNDRWLIKFVIFLRGKFMKRKILSFYF